MTTNTESATTDGLESVSDAVFRAAINCGHRINEKGVTLCFHPEREGHNATNQLHTRIRAALVDADTLLAASRAEVERLRTVLKAIGKDYESKQRVYSMMNGEPNPAIEQRLRVIDAALSTNPTKG